MAECKSKQSKRDDKVGKESYSCNYYSCVVWSALLTNWLIGHLEAENAFRLGTFCWRLFLFLTANAWKPESVVSANRFTPFSNFYLS